MSWIVKSKIVVPVDFSEFSLSALKTARDLVEDLSQVHVVHVIPPMSHMEPGAVWAELDDDKRIENVKASLREAVGNETYQAISVEVLIGHPPKSIVRHAKKIGAGLIIIHSKGYADAAHFLLGSTTERVVRHAECSVLVLRD